MNVTAQLVAWNATQAPAVSHNSVYTIAPLGSKQFLSFDFKDTLAEAGVSAGDISQYFMHLTVRAGPLSPLLRLSRVSDVNALAPSAWLLWHFRCGT